MNFVNAQLIRGSKIASKVRLLSLLLTSFSAEKRKMHFLLTFSLKGAALFQLVVH